MRCFGCLYKQRIGEKGGAYTPCILDEGHDGDCQYDRDNWVQLEHFPFSFLRPAEQASEEQKP